MRRTHSSLSRLLMELRRPRWRVGGVGPGGDGGEAYQCSACAFAFHSRASLCASAIWEGVISEVSSSLLLMAS
jgi:hypothetical protein